MLLPRFPDNLERFHVQRESRDVPPSRYVDYAFTGNLLFNDSQAVVELALVKDSRQFNLHYRLVTVVLTSKISNFYAGFRRVNKVTTGTINETN